MTQPATPVPQPNIKILSTLDVKLAQPWWQWFSSVSNTLAQLTGGPNPGGGPAIVTGFKWVLFTASQTWTVPPNTTEIMFEGWAAGGSGGGSLIVGPQRSSAGAGGGYMMLKPPVLDTSYVLTVGAGGAAVNASNTGNAGNAGGNTVVTGTNLGTYTANGGGGGAIGANAGGGGGAAPAVDAKCVIGLRGEDGESSGGGALSFLVSTGGNSPRGGRGGRANVGVGGNVPGGGGTPSNHTGTGDLSGPGANGWILAWYR